MDIVTEKKRIYKSILIEIGSKYLLDKRKIRDIMDRARDREID